MALPKSHHSMAIASVLVATIAAQGEPQRQTFAPHEMNEGDAPAPIVWPTPPLPDRTIKLETAEERHVRVVVVTDDLEQPWSMVFLPDGGMLVTERAGRVRLIRNGKLESKPIRGVPRVYTGGPRGLQGLMDIALHPSFRENGWVYLTYDKPSGTGGSTALARGRWNGVELVGVQELFDSEARDTEASRLAFGRDRIRADRNDFYTGDRFPRWKRNVFVGGLREGGIPRTGQVQRIVFNERWEELRREPLLTQLKQRIRDVRQGPDGLLYVLTAEEKGALLRLEPDPSGQ